MTKDKLIWLGIFFYFTVVFTPHFSFSQSKRVELVKANTLIGTTYMGQPMRKLNGNVVFKHAGAMMYCDSAYLFEQRNDLEAFSHIRITKGDSQSVSGDHMNYYGDIKLAKITGPNVILVNKSLTLYTTILEYDLNTDISKYFKKGTVIDKENTLVSDLGTFYKNQNLFVFIKNVVFKDKKHTIYTDTMEYNTETKIVKFRGPTRITGPSGTMNADAGEYNSISKTSNFKGRTKIEYSDFILNADKVFYNQFTQTGDAKGDVVVFSKKDSVTVFGETAKYWGATGRTKVFPEALMQSVSGGDTLFMSSDTLYAINDTLKKEKKIFAYHRVKVFNKMMQAICDSLIYDMADSTLTFFNDPVMWNSKNQMRGDTIKVITKTKKIDKILFRNKAFSISQDTVLNFNQVKGKNMVAYFKSNKINNVDVKGNAECIYFVLQGDTVTAALNRMNSEDMNVRFKNQKVNTIHIYKKPKGVYIPPHEIKDEDIRIKGFKWRQSERPSKEKVLGKYYNKIERKSKK